MFHASWRVPAATKKRKRNNQQKLWFSVGLRSPANQKKNATRPLNNSGTLQLDDDSDRDSTATPCSGKKKRKWAGVAVRNSYYLSRPLDEFRSVLRAN